ncbi:hypothetical protein F5884DRAFT_799785 [Xylogone sp. PMI_703]|nr:hypothetical protein F5884DRAFT_799785 [Xylogone sp. PMI_703]
MSHPQYTYSGPSEWSEGSWSEKYQCMEYYRLLEDGTYEWRYEKVEPQPDPRAPRYASIVEEGAVTTGFQNLSIGEQTENYTLAGGDLPAPEIADPQIGEQNANSAYPDKLPISPDPRADALDKDFKVYSSRHFTQGKLFKVVWTEPSGSTGTIATENVSATIFGQNAYSSIRRFVIIDAQHPGHSTCLPVLTYTSRGTTKHGVKPECHSIIYASDKRPHYMKDEDRAALKTPIMVKMDSTRHKLDSASRVNYSKLYTIEHNVKVAFIGRVDKDYMHKFVANYERVNRAFTYTEVPGGSGPSSGPSGDYPEASGEQGDGHRRRGQ